MLPLTTEPTMHAASVQWKRRVGRSQNLTGWTGPGHDDPAVLVDAMAEALPSDPSVVAEAVSRPDPEVALRDLLTRVPETRRLDAARLRRYAEAARRVVDKLSNTSAPQARFPAFFGPGHDWVPDHNWGGSGMVGLQEMLLAADPYGDELKPDPFR